MIGKDMKIREIIQAHPNAIEVLLARGICSCCLGELTLEESAENKGLDLEDLLRELRSKS
jgi:iron-sulfur cluster repair protein YtfE (RIC family)